MMLNNRCLNPAHQDRVEHCRGLCRSCYTIARMLVVQGKTTWEELEAEGKATAGLPKGPKTGSIKGWLLDGKSVEHEEPKDDLGDVF